MITLNGTEVEFGQEWVCACSGGHWEVGEDGSMDPKCLRKGGEYRTVVRNAQTGEDMGYEFDLDEAERLVRDWGWTDLGEGLLLKPGV